MSDNNRFQEDLQQVLRFNYGLNKLRFHPFVGINDPDVQRQIRDNRSTGLAMTRQLIENEVTLITTKPRSDDGECKICTEVFVSGDNIVRHKGCSDASHIGSHIGCIELWLQHSPECPCCKVVFDSAETQSLKLANEKLRRDVESAHDPVAYLQPMVDRVNRMSGYLSVAELFALHTAIMGLDDANTDADEVSTDSDTEMDWGVNSDDGGGFDWDDEGDY